MVIFLKKYVFYILNNTVAILLYSNVKEPKQTS